MNITRLCNRRAAQGLLAAAALAAFALPNALRAQSPAEFQELKAMVQQMKQTIDAQNARIAELEKAKAAPAASASQRTLDKVAAGQPVSKASPVAARDSLNDQQEAASRPMEYTLDPQYKGFIPVPNTAVLIKINAKPHVDMTYDNINPGNQNRFVPAMFPLEGSSNFGGDGQFHMNANASQIRVDVRAPEMEGNFRFYYQNDFFGSGSDVGYMKYRVQHLYGQFHGFKAGFTYGAWEDPDSWPDTVDYEGPNAVIFSRRPVAQYTQLLNENWNITYGVEHPDIYVDTASGPNAGGYQFTRLPDFAMNTRFEKAGFGHLQFSGTLRDLSARDSKGVDHSVTGWGLNASAVLNLGDATVFQLLGVYGEGVGGMGNDTSFINSDAAFTNKGVLEALPYWSMHVALTQKWSKMVRTTFTYGYVNLDNTNGQASTFYHASTYASANVVWQLRPKWSVGLEGLYGFLVVKNDQDSDDHYRFQVGMVYSLFD